MDGRLRIFEHITETLDIATTSDVLSNSRGLAITVWGSNTSDDAGFTSRLDFHQASRLYEILGYAISEWTDDE